MLGDLPDYNTRIKKRAFLFAVLLLVIGAFYLIQRHERAKIRPSEELKTGVKALTDPESVADGI